MSTADCGNLFETGDEWGLVEVVPAENCEHYAEVTRQFAGHHEDKKFSPIGYAIEPFTIPPAAPEQPTA